MHNYILIEMAKRNFVIARNGAGKPTEYVQVATCRSKFQAETLIDLLNGAENG